MKRSQLCPEIGQSKVHSYECRTRRFVRGNLSRRRNLRDSNALSERIVRLRPRDQPVIRPMSELVREHGEVVRLPGGGPRPRSNASPVRRRAPGRARTTPTVRRRPGRPRGERPARRCCRSRSPPPTLRHEGRISGQRRRRHPAPLRSHHHGGHGHEHQRGQRKDEQAV